MSRGGAAVVTVAATPSGSAWRLARARRSARDLVTLTKPGIIWLLLVTTAPAMALAEQDWPDPGQVALVLLGGMLTAGGANALNQWWDRDIDAVMARTQHRPLPQGRIAPRTALGFGLALVALGGAQLAITVNVLSAALALGAAVFYVGVYTMWLKRSTPQNIVIGGAAGAAPPLVGWAAVHNSLDVAAGVLFLIVFLWTPPHFWALALRYRDEYARAGVPMLPVVAGEAATKRQILIYAAVLTAASLGLVASGDGGWIYGVSAAVLGLGFLAEAERLRRGLVAPMRVFFFSILYLPLLFLAVAVDALV